MDLGICGSLLTATALHGLMLPPLWHAMAIAMATERKLSCKQLATPRAARTSPNTGITTGRRPPVAVAVVPCWCRTSCLGSTGEKTPSRERRGEGLTDEVHLD